MIVIDNDMRKVSLGIRIEIKTFINFNNRIKALTMGLLLIS